MITKAHKKQIFTVEQETYDLVKGDYSPEEASEIVNDLFCKKINFLNSKSFSQLIKFGSKNPHTEQRIRELKLAQEQAKKLILEAKESGKSLRVNSTISLELI